MYLPKSKYKQPKHTSTGEFVDNDGKAYTGWYIETFEGKFVTGKVPSITSKPLTNEYSSEPFNIPKKFVSDIIIPTDIDYNKGSFTRYFIQDNRNTQIIEGNRKTYLYYRKQKHTSTVEVEWLLTTPIEDVNKGPYIYFGSASKNKEATHQASLKMKGLETQIKSYSQFVK